MTDRKIVSVSMTPEEYEELERVAGKTPLSTALKTALKRAPTHGMDTTPTKRLECGCVDATHAEAEQRIDRELVPRLRRKIAPRAADEGPHEYIARYWAADELKRDFFVDLHTALGWIKDDDADTHEDYD